MKNVIKFVAILSLGIICLSRAGEANPSVKVLSIEIQHSIGLQGGGACYFDNSGNIVYQRIVPNSTSALTEKRFVMKDDLKIEFDEIVKEIQGLKIGKPDNKSKANQEPAAGSSYISLKVNYTDGSSTNLGPSASVNFQSLWLICGSLCNNKSDSYIPNILPFDEKNFGNLKRFVPGATLQK